MLAEEIYGIPREQVIGSSNKLRFEMNGARAGRMKLAELNSFDDREAKPQNIALHVGRRPILAFGNSDGDLPMLRYTKTGKGPRLALLLHHDDVEREVAYDREFRLSPLNEGLDKADAYGITVVSMKRDWNVIFPKAFVNPERSSLCLSKTPKTQLPRSTFCWNLTPPCWDTPRPTTLGCSKSSRKDSLWMRHTVRTSR